IDLTAAALLLLVAALLSTLLGRAGAIVGIVGGFVALNYFFTAPRESLDVQKGDDLLALVAFAVASGVLSWTVSRLNEARRTAEQRETVVAGAADALVALLGLVMCTLRAPGLVTTATAPGVAGQVTVVRI